MTFSIAGKHIALLTGGPGSEREVSLRSGANVANGLRAAGAIVTEIDVRGPDFVLPPETEFAFLMIHGTFGEDGQLQAELERRGMPYSGEDVRGSEVAFDKILSKRAFDEVGIPTPRWEVIRAGQTPKMSAPLVIKAPKQGSSVGVYLCPKPGDVAPALAKVVEYDHEILVEQLITGIELTVGVLGAQALPIIMIKGSYDYARKYPWSEAAKKAKQANPQLAEALHTCPAPLSEEQTHLVQQLAIEAHDALGLKTYSRVDLLLDPHGGAWVLEANTIPGMTESSLLPEAALVAGIELPELVTRIVELSLAARPA
jgi:D-alanine-D-alanine ligase